MVEESVKTKRVRERILRQWEEEARLITPDSLALTVQKIHQWISLHALHRVVLKNKAIHLFDQNQNTAALSERVRLLAQNVGNPLESSL